MTFIVLFIGCFIILIYSYINSPTHMNKEFITFISIIYILCLYSFISIHIRNIKKQIYRPSIFFLLGFTIVHFQYILYYILDIDLLLKQDIWVSEKIVCKALVLSSIGGLCFIIGYQIYEFIEKRKCFVQLKIKSNVNSKLHNATYLIVISYIAFAGYLIYVNPEYLKGNYGHVDIGNAANRFFLILRLSLNSAIIINSRNIYLTTNTIYSLGYYVKKMGLLLNSLILIHILLALYIGDRGPAITIIFFYFAGYVFNVKIKPKTIVTIICTFLAIICMTLVSNYRSFSKEISPTERLLLAVEGNENKYDNMSTDELAGSVRALHYAVWAVPDRINFKYGWFQIRQVLICIPGVSNLLEYIDPGIQNQNSARLLTYIDQGTFYSYGIGSSIVADFYIDLGIIGVICGMLLFGIFISRLEISIFSYKQTNMYLYIFAMVYMSRIIYISRSTALLPLQECVWICMIVMINNFILKGKKQK